MRVARQRGERSGKREGEEREELEKKEKKEGAPAAESSRICTWTRLSVEPLQPDLAGLAEEATEATTMIHRRCLCGRSPTRIDL